MVSRVASVLRSVVRPRKNLYAGLVCGALAGKSAVLTAHPCNYKRRMGRKRELSSRGRENGTGKR